MIEYMLWGTVVGATIHLMLYWSQYLPIRNIKEIVAFLMDINYILLGSATVGAWGCLILKVLFGVIV